MSHFTLILSAIILSVTFGLSGCGGGGGAPQPQAPGIPAPDSERQMTPGAELMKAPAAYRRDLTGRGVTIGYYEAAIDKNDPELAGKLVGNRYDEIEPGTYSNLNATATLEEATEHATQAAKIAVGKRDDRGVHGIAYGSKIEFVSLSNAEFNRLETEQWDRIRRGLISIDDLLGAEARAINYLNDQTPIAFTAIGTSTDYSSYTRAEAEAHADQDGQLTALRQASTSAADRTIWVFGADNISGSHPTAEGYLPVHFPELRGHVIAAVAVDSNGIIADYSNRCGDAREFCIAAPGEHRVPTGLGGYRIIDGTSYAVPAVAAALAILKQAFPSIGNDEIVQRLYSTADKSGPYADRANYGQGLVDLDAATRPVGTLQLMAAGDVGGEGHSATGSTMFLSPPFGDAFPQAFKGREVLLLDRLQSPFFSDFSAFAQSASIDYSRRLITDLLDRLQNPDSQPSGNTISEWLGLAGTRMSFDSVSLSFGEDNRAALAKSFTVSPKRDAPVLTLAALHEPDSALGARTEGAFGRQRSASLAAQLSHQRELRGWSASASFAASLTSIHASGGIISSATPALASSFALKAQRSTEFGAFHVSVTQPLRVEAGHVRIRYPSARTPDRKVVYETFQADLAPSGRQLDFEIGATRQLSHSARLGMSLRVTRDPGHIDRSPAVIGASMGFAAKF